jgi:hypothetical protein
MLNSRTTSCLCLILLAAHGRVDVASAPCPTVFIYSDLPRLGDALRPAEVSQLRAYGGPTNTPGLFNSDPFSVGDVIVNRLFRSERCKVTIDPKKADLFLVPLWHAVRKLDNFNRFCRSTSRNSFLNSLQHWSSDTAKKHVMIVPKGHLAVAAGGCSWVNVNGSQLEGLQVYALSHTYAGLGYADRSWRDPSPPMLDGRVISIPYASSFHWMKSIGHAPPWTVFDNRNTRIHYVGQPHGLQKTLRERIARDCNRMGRPHCFAETNFDNEKSLLQKQHSVFCLEPEGDSPYRKSVYDSIASGCIPVFFSRDTAASCPFHWGSFVRNSTVLFSQREYYLGSKTLKTLIDMPEHEVSAMQAAISANAHRLQYAYDDMPGGDDAVELLLKKAAMRARGASLEELSD